MVSPLDVGLLVGLGLLGLLGVAEISNRFDRLLNRLALGLFRDKVEATGRRRSERKRALQSVHSTTTYPVYASRTLLASAIVGIAGSLIAVSLIQRLLAAVIGSEEAIRSGLPPQLAFLVPTEFGAMSVIQIFLVLLISAATFGLGGALLTYYLRWGTVTNKASNRAVLIDESIARTIAFIYALSRSGMAFPEVMRTVAKNRKAFGESAEEVGVIVKDMDLFGADLVSAMERASRWTPSDQFSDFAENFANVLQSGRNVSEYLREQYEQHQEERLDNQEQLLELFGALGEGYVAGLVAGPLFFITLMVIAGLLFGGLLEVLQLVVYLLIPLANVGFGVYLDSVSEPLKTFEAPVDEQVEGRSIKVRSAGARAQPDGGRTPGYDLEANRFRFAAYQRVRRLQKTVLNPVESIVRNPTEVFMLSVPLGIVYLFVRLWPFLVGENPLTVPVVDDFLIQTGLIVAAPYALAREVHVRRIRRIEAAIPDLLDRLSSTNEAGMTFTESLRRVDKSDLGALDVEVRQLLADIDWGARTERALHRFSERIGSSSIARITALITNAMLASGHLGPVIKIAADEAREDRRLKKSRRQEMVLYVIIIYLSFMVFIAIAFALQNVLVPAIPSAEDLGGVGAGPVTGGASLPIDPAQGQTRNAYTLLLFHAALVQASLSGFIAGQMGEGSVKDGTKHAVIMVGLAYVLFLLFA